LQLIVTGEKPGQLNCWKSIDVTKAIKKDEGEDGEDGGDGKDDEEDFISNCLFVAVDKYVCLIVIFFIYIYFYCYFYVFIHSFY
jgi:hypothetical protein